MGIIIASAGRRSARRTGLARRAAFTIIELLVVVGIIAVLLGLLLPALSGVKKRGRKTTELNNIKHLGHAWTLYGQNNNDAALPGFLDQAVQANPSPGVSRGWGVQYDYPDRSKIPIDANNYSGPWTWRLISYLDFNHEMLHSHLNEVDPDSLTMKSEAQSIAYEPAFGYNGYYIGGHWSMIGSGPSYPMYKFYNHVDQVSKRPLAIPLGIGQIQRSSALVLFCASTHVTGGQPFYSASKLPADTSGSHLVTPPIVGAQTQWQPLEQDPITAFQALGNDVYAPLGRHTGTIAIVYVDGHVDNQGYEAMYDQRKWIDAADTRFFKHVPAP